VSDPSRPASIQKAAFRRGLPFFEISAATHRGLEELVHEFFRLAARPAPRTAPAWNGAAGAASRER
jgi:hypothetical protein